MIMVKLLVNYGNGLMNKLELWESLSSEIPIKGCNNCLHLSETYTTYKAVCDKCFVVWSEYNKFSHKPSMWKKK